jgi:hypothetical protein
VANHQIERECLLSGAKQTLATGFTDSHFTRDLGIGSYGFDLAIVPENEYSRIHGDDERISVEAFEHGVSNHLATIGAMVYD